MISRIGASSLLGVPRLQDRLVSVNQTATEISNLLRTAEYNSRSDAKKLVKYFDVGSDYENCRLVWRFLRKYIHYIKEPASRQTSKEVRRLLYDGYGDCKHGATFAVSICNQLGVPTFFRLASYERFNRTPTHAYAIAIIDNEIIPIDFCMPEFATEGDAEWMYNVPPIRKRK